MEFSRRTDWDLRATQWAEELEKRRASGARIIDLTASNPTRCGFRYEPSQVLSPLVSPTALLYRPDPRGSLKARQAISRYYAARGCEVDVSRLLMTASTSEAYSYLFRLLANPGDEILIAQPSYPLLDFLAQLDDVRLTPYGLLYDHGWQIDLEGLRHQLNSRRTTGQGSRIKAIALVHPNNPTGHYTRSAERAALESICREYDLALIVDEVFLDYPFSAPESSFAAGEHAVPTFVLSGVSKIAALPQMKVAWIAAFGPDRERTAALDRLEVIADTFLSTSAPVECALPGWLEGGEGLRKQIRERTQRNLAALDGVLAGSAGGGHPPVNRLHVEAGWYAVLRVPAIAGDEQIALELLTRRGVAVHPGEFFGFSEPGRLVVSLLPSEEEFLEGVRLLIEEIGRQ